MSMFARQKHLHGHRNEQRALILIVVLAAMAVAGFQRLFSSFAFYDDEGYVMLSLRQYLSGKSLYDEVYSQYGPAYFALESLLHRTVDLPVTHDVTRFKTLVLWLIVSIMSGWYLQRMTASWWWAIVGSIAAFFHLDRLSMEPGHPQELCLLGLVAILLLSTWIPTGTRTRQTWVLIGMGVVSGVIAMTKLNVGGLLFVSVVSASLGSIPKSTATRLAWYVVTIAMIGLPILLVGSHIWTPRGLQLPVVTVTSVVAIQAWVWRTQQPMLQTTSVLGFVLAMSLTALLFATTAIASGTSLSGVVDGIMRQHLNFVESQYRDAQIYYFCAAFAIVSMVFAFLPDERRKYPERLIRIVWIAVVVGVSLRYLTDTFSPLTHGGMDRGHALLLIGVVTPSLWLLLSNYRDRTGHGRAFQNQQFCRTFLCLVAMLQPLTGIPMPGTQLAIASLPLLLALLIGIWEQYTNADVLGHDEKLLRLAPVWTLSILVFLTLGLRCYVNSQTRLHYEALDLPGASLLRRPAEETARIRWVVGRLQDEAKTFLCYPLGFCSLYLWSDMEPPTGWNTTDWSRLLTAEQQRDIIRAVDRMEDVWVVSLPWGIPAKANEPLVDYIQQEFVLEEQRDGIELWQRRKAEGGTAEPASAQQ